MFGNYYILNSQSKWAAICISKNACTSLKSRILADHGVPETNFLSIHNRIGYGSASPYLQDARQGVPEGLRSFAVWRDPVERFKSVFKYLALSGGNQDRPTKPSPSMDDWLDWTEIELKKPILEQDEHIRKQSDYYKVEDVEVVVPLSQLTEWFAKQGFGELPHEHARRTPVRLTPAQAARVRRIYWQDYMRIGSLMPSWQDRPLVTGLWIADELPPIARLCILSFLHHGFRFKLHTYGEVIGVPEGVEIVDANSILASSEIHHDHTTANTASTVGLIRNRYLSRNGGFWIDLDIICLDPEKFPDDWPWFAMDDSGTVGTDALGFPAGHPVMLDLERLTEDPACPMLWDDKAALERKSNLLTRFPEVQTRRQQVDVNSIDFDNFSEAVKHYGLLNRAASPASFQPVMPIKWKNFFDGSLSLGSPELREAWAIKLWHEKRLDCTDTLRDMERNSLVADLMHLHGCAPDYLGKKTQKPCSTPRILIGVCSCVPHGDKREAVRATWASRPPAEIDIRFFIGGTDPQNKPDVVGLPANDSYQHLPAKVMAFFRHALKHFDFDWLFKCNDDTYVDLTRLPELIGDSVDLIGNNFLNFRNGPSGGAGYFLSRHLVQQIVTKVDIPDTGSEDVIIGEAAVELGAVTCSSDRLIFNNAHFPRPENDIVTSHWCSPARLHAIHTIRHSHPTEEVLVKHPHWEDKILLFENGVFVKKSSNCAGTFKVDDTTFSLDWFDWDKESYEISDGYIQGNHQQKPEPKHFQPPLSPPSLDFGRESLLEAVDPDSYETEFPLISCVMPTYGRPAYVNEAIQMFLDQDYPNKELIILNDCVDQVFTCELPPESGVRIINHPTRFPTLGDKRNACIELANGIFIAIWDDDDVHLPWRLSYTYRMIMEYKTPFYLAEEFYEYRGGDQPLHEKYCSHGQPCHPNSLFTKSIWQQVGGYPSIGVGEDSQFFQKIDHLLGQEKVTYPIRKIDRFFILRSKSDYPHTCMGGGSGQLDTTPGKIELNPAPIADPALHSLWQTSILQHNRYSSASYASTDPTKPILSVCVSLKNRSAVPHKDQILPLFQNTVKSLAKAAENLCGTIELVVADFGSDDDPPANWITQLSGGMSVKLLNLDGNFSRGRGLNEAVRHASSNRLLLTDADVLVNEAALRRAIELIDGDQAWFPSFHCFNEEGELTHWMDLGYGIVGLERKVFDAAGGVPEFESWGGEDNIFHDRVQTQVPGVRERCGKLRHQWHPESIRHENYRNTRKEDYETYVSRSAVPITNQPDALPTTSIKFQSLKAEHPHWSGTLHFYENGRFLRPGGDTGIYELDDDHSITLRWDRWPAEQLLWDPTDNCYRGMNKDFTLQAP